MYDLSLFLHKIIKKSILENLSQGTNSFQLIDKLNGNQFDDNYVLASLNVIPLFINVPTDLALKEVEKKWNYIGGNTNIPKEEFLFAIWMILHSIFFSFNEIFYKQTFGMGFPLSPISANIVLEDLEDLEEQALEKLSTVYYRYVDIICI